MAKKQINITIDWDLYESIQAFRPQLMEQGDNVSGICEDALRVVVSQLEAVAVVKRRSGSLEEVENAYLLEIHKEHLRLAAIANDILQERAKRQLLESAK
jgi:hypothetical protein